MTTYKETIDYLYSHLPTFQKEGKRAIKPKLTNITILCDILGNPQNNFHSIHVAGTNGKGSSSHFITSIFMQAGYKVGLYTSPHLKDYRERFRINGQLVPEDFIIEFVKKYHHEIENLRASFFEVSVALAFKYFSDEKVDVAVIEVGLGGRLDSTNIISKVDLSLITNIGFDHTDVLGDTLEKIAFEKAGIIKPKVPVVISEYTKETKPVFEQIATLNNSPITFAQDIWQIERVDEDVRTLSLTIRNTDSLYTINTELSGIYQQNNIRGVLQAIEVLREKYTKLTHKAVLEGFQKVIQNTGLKGRWQVLNENPLMICDTGHNDHAFQITLQKIKAYKGKVHYILGFVKDKDISHLNDYLKENSIIYFSEFDSPRARKGEELANLHLLNANIFSIFSNVNEAISCAKNNSGPNDLIFIGGSTYLIAEIAEI